MNRVVASLCLFAVCMTSSLTPATAAPSKYAKSEVDKAVAKCVGALFGGALLGGLLGGKKDRKKGVLIGAAAGGILCAIIVRNAKRKDRILAAQRETAKNNRNYQTVFQDDNGNSVNYVGNVREANTIDGARLQPVKYQQTDGTITHSPSLDTGGALCRQIDSSLSYGKEANSNLPSQVFCRTPEGDWEPYAVKVA